MQLDDFLRAVQAGAGLATTHEALCATRATLETLAELIGGEARQLASQLPHELGIYLRGEPGRSEERFDLQEFYRRVGEREAMDFIRGMDHAHAVFATLCMAVSPGALRPVQAKLPGEYRDELFVSRGEESELYFG